MKQEKIKNLLGFAQRAGKLISGDNTCRAKFNKLRLIILAEDCSKGTAEYYKYRCLKAGKPILVWGKKVELGIAIGKSPRTVLGITDPNFTRQVIELATGGERIGQFFGGE